MFVSLLRCLGRSALRRRRPGDFGCLVDLCLNLAVQGDLWHQFRDFLRFTVRTGVTISIGHEPLGHCHGVLKCIEVRTKLRQCRVALPRRHFIFWRLDLRGLEIVCVRCFITYRKCWQVVLGLFERQFRNVSRLRIYCRRCRLGWSCQRGRQHFKIWQCVLYELRDLVIVRGWYWFWGHGFGDRLWHWFLGHNCRYRFRSRLWSRLRRYHGCGGGGRFLVKIQPVFFTSHQFDLGDVDAFEFIFDSRDQRRFNEVIRQTRYATAESVKYIGTAVLEYDIKFVTGESEAVFEVAHKLADAERCDDLLQSETLSKAGQSCRLQDLIRAVVSHQDDIGTLRHTGIRCGQGFQLRQCIDTNSGDVFNHEKYSGTFIGMLFEQASKSRESLHGAGGQLSAHFFE